MITLATLAALGAKALPWVVKGAKVASAGVSAYKVGKGIFGERDDDEPDTASADVLSGLGGLAGHAAGAGWGGEKAREALGSLASILEKRGEDAYAKSANHMRDMNGGTGSRLLQAIQQNQKQHKHLNADNEGQPSNEIQKHRQLEELEDELDRKKSVGFGLSSPLLKKLLEMTQLGMDSFQHRRMED
jgi:hypothetical protein